MTIFDRRNYSLSEPGSPMIETLDLHGVWPSPLATRELMAFERSLSERTAASILRLDPAAFREVATDLKRELASLWDANDLPRFIGVASAFHRARRLNPSYTQRFAWALTTQWRFAEAADVIASTTQDDHHHWFVQALAMGGAGRLDEAAAAADRCAALVARASPPDNVKAEMKSLDRRRSAADVISGWRTTVTAIRRHRRDGDHEAAASCLKAFLGRRAAILKDAIEAVGEGPPRQTWTSFRRHLTGCLLLAAPNLAADALRTLADARASAEDVEQAAPLFSATAAFADPGRQADVLRALVALSEGASWRGFVERALDVLKGEASWRDLVSIQRPPGPITAAVAAALANAGRHDAAILLLGELSQGKAAEAARDDLVACQSMDTRGKLGFRTAPRPGPRRIFDVFPYNGEIELLKIKLHEMSSWVDRFVIVEAATTFSGRPKPTYLAGHAPEIRPFLPKIDHVVVRAFPEHARSPWSREFYQRDQAVAALDGVCAPDDLILLTDVDEVLDHRTIERFDGEGAPVTMHLLRYFLNYRKDEQHGNASLWRARHFERWGASLMRNLLAHRLWHLRVQDAGWHFTSVGDAKDIARKLASYSHQENNRPDNEARYGSHLDRLRAGEVEPGWAVCDIDILPAYVRERRGSFAHLLL